MSKGLVSIIVPAYNAEKYIGDCIKSILNQTYTNIEVIIVNDGSFDNTEKCVESFMNKDDRVKLISQDNSGVSAARNNGKKIAKGDYIIWIDADDVLDDRMIEILVNNMTNSGADISSCGVDKNFEEKQISYDNSYILLNREESMKRFFMGQKVNSGIWNKLFRKEIVEEIDFDTTLRINEDKMFLYETLKRISLFVYTDLKLYKYMIRDASASNSIFSEKWVDVIKVNEFIYKDTKFNPELEMFSRYQLLLSKYTIVGKIIREGQVNDYYDIWIKQKEEFKQIRLFDILTLFNKKLLVGILLLKYLEPLYLYTKKRSSKNEN